MAGVTKTKGCSTSKVTDIEGEVVDSTKLSVMWLKGTVSKVKVIGVLVCFK